MSRPPNVSTASATAASLWARSLTSQRMNAPPTRSAVAVPASTSMSATTTRAPRSARRSATPAPMPLEPPVTRATLPSKSWSVMGHPRGRRCWLPQDRSGRAPILRVRPGDAARLAGSGPPIPPGAPHVNDLDLEAGPDRTVVARDRTAGVRRFAAPVLAFVGGPSRAHRGGLGCGQRVVRRVGLGARGAARLRRGAPALATGGGRLTVRLVPPRSAPVLAPRTRLLVARATRRAARDGSLERRGPRRDRAARRPARGPGALRVDVPAHRGAGPRARGLVPDRPVEPLPPVPVVRRVPVRGVVRGRRRPGAHPGGGGCRHLRGAVPRGLPAARPGRARAHRGGAVGRGPARPLAPARGRGPRRAPSSRLAPGRGGRGALRGALGGAGVPAAHRAPREPGGDPAVLPAPHRPGRRAHRRRRGDGPAAVARRALAHRARRHGARPGGHGPRAPGRPADRGGGRRRCARRPARRPRRRVARRGGRHRRGRRPDRHLRRAGHHRPLPVPVVVGDRVPVVAVARVELLAAAGDACSTIDCCGWRTPPALRLPTRSPGGRPRWRACSWWEVWCWCR